MKWVVWSCCLSMLCGVVPFDAVDYRALSEREFARCFESPHVQAFLDMVAYSEGTFSPQGYRISFGGSLFNRFKDHPRIKYAKGALRSDAAGRYQFLSKTWDYVAQKLRLGDFSPKNQDRAAVQLIFERNVLDDLLRGRFDKTLNKTATVWASFPDATYGQRTQSYKNLKNFYLKRLSLYMKSGLKKYVTT